MSEDEKRIFVGGLKYETDEATVRNYFSQFGPVADVKIVKFPPPDGRSKGFGFVRFGSLAAKEHCMSVSSHMIDGKAVELRLAQAEAPGRGGGGNSYGGGNGGSGGGKPLESLSLDDVAYRRLFVGNVDHSWSEDVLRQYFEQLGQIQELAIKYGSDGKCLGFAFMTFESADDLDRIQQSRPHSIQNRQLETRRPTPKHYVGTAEAKLKTKKIWIGAPEDEKGRRGHSGLGDNTSDEDLKQYFSNFGTVTTINQMMWPDTKKKRGYGYIEFEDTDHVDKVVLSRVHVINDVRLEVKKAVLRQPGEKDSAKSGMQNSFGMGGQMGGNNMMGMASMGGYGGYGMSGMGMMGGGMMGGGMMDTSSMYGGGGMGGSGSGMMGSGWSSANSGFDASGGRGAARKRLMDGSGGPVKRPRLEPRDPESETMRRMFVGNLSYSTTNEQLEEYLNKFGTVQSVSIKTHPDTNRSRGFGFVIFARSSDVDNVLASRPHELMGAKLDCKRSTPKTEGAGMEERVKKIWIGKPDGDVKSVGTGLNEDTTDEALEEYFSQFGRVVSIKQFLWNDTNKKRGYGYITFDDEDVVDKICLLGIHRVAGVNLYTKKALSRELLSGKQEKSGGHGGGGMNNMGGMSHNSMGGGMGSMAMMNMGGMGGANNNMQNMMNSMQSNMQHMLNQMRPQASNPVMMNMMGNMQNMMSQMDQMRKQGGGGGAKFQSMMSEMNNMIGSARGIKQESDAGGGRGENVQEKMMSMMNNMMTMMNSMASMMQSGGGGGSGSSMPGDAGGYGSAGNYGAGGYSSYGSGGYNGSGGYDYSSYSGAGYGGTASSGGGYGGTGTAGASGGYGGTASAGSGYGGSANSGAGYGGAASFRYKK